MFLEVSHSVCLNFLGRLYMTQCSVVPLLDCLASSLYFSKQASICFYPSSWCLYFLFNTSCFYQGFVWHLVLDERIFYKGWNKNRISFEHILRAVQRIAAYMILGLHMCASVMSWIKYKKWPLTSNPSTVVTLTVKKRMQTDRVYHEMLTVLAIAQGEEEGEQGARMSFYMIGSRVYNIV